MADDIENLYTLCTRLLTEVRNLKCQLSDQLSIAVTVSLGVCFCNSRYQADVKLQALLDAADTILYKVKSAKKNDVLYTEFEL